jgi:uncharacterized membrane protein required for colicin V production
MGLALDVLLGGVLLLYAWLGWRSGFMRQAISLGALGFGALSGWVFAPLAAPWLKTWLTPNDLHAYLAAFIFFACAVALGTRLLASWADSDAEHKKSRAEQVERDRWDRMLGGAFGLLKAFLVLLVLAPVSTGLMPPHPMWSQSRFFSGFCSAGARVLPADAVREVQVWVSASTERLQRELARNGRPQRNPAAMEKRAPND